MNKIEKKNRVNRVNHVWVSVFDRIDKIHRI